MSFSDSYDLGTRSEFERKIEEGLRYTNETQLLKDSLEKQKSKTLATIRKVQKKHLSRRSIFNILVWTGMILTAILYPLRLCYFLIKWSILTLKKNAV